MSEANSPYFRAGMIHGAYAAAMPARVRPPYHPAYARSWMYRRGFARAFLAARGPQKPAEATAVAPLRESLPKRAGGAWSLYVADEHVLRWGHARATDRRRREIPVPAWLAAIDREYDRRRKARRRTARAAS